MRMEPLTELPSYQVICKITEDHVSTFFIHGQCVGGSIPSSLIVGARSMHI